MLTFMLHITVKEGCEAEAVETLTAIENEAHKDHGCLNFSWLQHEQEPHRFTLFEQWESQDDLDAHLNRDTSRWERFVPCLVGEPRSESFRSVSASGELVEEGEARRFVEDWFDKLSRHVPLKEILPMVADHDLEMIFPEAILRNKAEFTKWYTEVGQLFEDQTHELETLEWQPASDLVNIQLSVIWRARNKKNGSRIISRAQQGWTLKRSFSTGEPVIVKYRILSLDDIR